MKLIQKFTDSGCLVASSEIPIKKMAQLPLPYTGNKKKLASHIYNAIVKHNVEFNSVLDAFSGSAAVSFLFKLMGKRVLSNDLLTSSYINSVAFVENQGIKLTDEEKKFLLHHNNKNKTTFVEDNYLGTNFRPSGKTCRFNKFTLKECQHLDNFRANIDELCNIHAQSLGLAANAAVVLRLPFGNIDMSADVLSHRIKQKTEYGPGSNKKDRRIGIYYDDQYNLNFDKWFIKYVNDFMNSGTTQCDASDIKIKRASFLANLQQHILRDCFVGGRYHKGQALAELNNRLSHQKNQLKATYATGGSTEMDFFTQSGEPGQGMKWWTFADADTPGQCLATNMDIIELLKSNFCKVDCVYFDPPYGGMATNYAAIYRFLEEYIYSDTLENLPHIQKYADRFTKKSTYEKSFIEMLESAKHIPVWMFSYNNSAWKDIEYIANIIKQFKSNVITEILTDDYRYLYRKKQGRNIKGIEYLVIAR